MRTALLSLGIFTDADLEWMLATGRREDIPAHTILVQEGTPIAAVYIVIDGTFAVSVAGKGVGRLLSGEVVGEVSFVDSRPPSATVQAEENARVLAIPRPLLTRKLAQDIAFAARFYRAMAVFLADRLRHTTSRLGYGQDAPRNEDPADEDDLDPAALTHVSLASAQFDRLLQRLRGV